MSDNCIFDTNPYSQSQSLKSHNIFNLNYTNQDFWSMKSRLVDFIKEKFGKNFNDFSESDIAIMLIENWAFLADTLSFKIDQIANEIFIDTVSEVDNAFRLAKLIGFKPTPPIAARSLWTARLNNAILTDLVIPAPLDIEVTANNQTMTIELFPADSNNQPIFDQDIIIPAGQVVNSSIVGLEGFTFTDQFQGTGEVGQTLTLDFSPVIYDSIQVTIDGIGWTQVEYFTDSQPRREYRVDFDANYQGFVIFGNNRAGLIPSKGSVINVKYRQGGGVKGNIVTGFANTETIVPVEGFDYSIPVSLTNYTKGEFGYDGDSIEDIRRKLPEWVRTQDRAVTGLDYKTIADQFVTPYQGQTGKSTAVLRNYGCAANIIDLYVLVKDGTDGLQFSSNEFKVLLVEEFDKKKMFTDYLCVKDGSIIYTDINLDVVLDKFYRKFEEEFRERIKRRTDNFFSLNNWEYGQSLKDTDLLKELSDIREVKRYDVTFTTNDVDNSGVIVVARFNEIIRPDEITISFMYE